jgi:branched-chain amino acid transport system ATP-binding protein
LLEVKDIHTYYGESYALQGVSLEIQQGEFVTLLGRNGAGKTTTIKTIMGFLIPRPGAIHFKGKEITGLRPHQIARMGIGFVPEDRGIFSSLTVPENLNLPAGVGPSDGWALDKIFEHFSILKERIKHKGSELSGGEQQMLAIARILRSGADILLLDEPTEGLAPLLIRAIEGIMKEIKKSKVTVLLVEQNIHFATQLADRHYILYGGKVAYHDTNQEFKGNEEVKKRFLGV